MAWYDPRTWTTRIQQAYRQPTRTSQRLEQRQVEWRRRHVEPYRPPPTQQRRALQEMSGDRLTMPSIWGMVRKERVVPTRKEIKAPTERKVAIEKEVAITPRRMGLLIGAKAILPHLRERLGRAEERRVETEARHVIPLREYRTYPIYGKGIKVAREWRSAIERWEGVPGIREKIRETPILREAAALGRGIIVSPPSMIEFGAQIPPGLEYAVREPKLFAKAVPIGGAIMLRETARAFRERPLETAGEFIGVGILTAGGARAFRFGVGKIYEPVKFYRKAEIPVERIVKPKVIRGAERFPVSKVSPRELIKTFEESKYIRLKDISKIEEEGVKTWHAAPKEFDKAIDVAIGESELPGLYTASSLSPYFLRVATEPHYKLFGLGLERALKPSALLIKTKGIERLPKGIRERRFEGAREFMFEEAELGKAYITPKYERGWRYVPREEEAVIPPETPLARIEFTKFLKWKGKKIPIHEYEVEGLTKGIARDIKTIEKAGEVSRRYGKEYERYAEYREPLITPPELAISALQKATEEKIKRITKEERVVTPFKEERRPPPERRKREYHPIPPERIVPPTIERIFEPFERPPKEPPFIPREEWKPPPEEPFRESPYYPPKYPPYYLPSYPPATPPILIPSILVAKKPKKKKKLKRKEREWFERHYIPTIKELMKAPKRIEIAQPKMSTLPEINMPKL